MKSLLDQKLSPGLVEFFDEAGHAVSHVRDLGMSEEGRRAAEVAALIPANLEAVADDLARREQGSFSIVFIGSARPMAGRPNASRVARWS